MLRVAGKRIAVVGGTGFIGSHFVSKAVRLGANTLAIARSDNRLSNLSDIDGLFEFAACDVADAERINAALIKFRPDAVVHFAAEPDAMESPEHMERCIRVNTAGVLNTISGAVASGASRFVFADTSKVYGNSTVPFTASHAESPICSYAVAKAAAWNFCKVISAMHGIGVVSLRPAFVFGPRQNWNLINYVKQCVANGVPVKLQGGSQTRDLLFVEDAVEAFLMAVSSSAAVGHAIPLGGGRELSVIELCKIILNTLDSNVSIEAGAEKPRMTEIWRSYTDNADARRLLGWFPRTTLVEGLRATLGLPQVSQPEEEVAPGTDLNLEARKVSA